MGTPSDLVKAPVSLVLDVERMGRRETGGKFAVCFLIFLIKQGELA